MKANAHKGQKPQQHVGHQAAESANPNYHHDDLAQFAPKGSNASSSFNISDYLHSEFGKDKLATVGSMMDSIKYLNADNWERSIMAST